MKRPVNEVPSIKEIFGDAIELGPEQREAYLDRVCAGDPVVRSRVEELLDAHDGDEDSAQLFAAAAAEVARATLALDETAPGRCIGRYKLLRQIGEGGFGTVFEAEQTEPVVRRVALKIIKLGMDTRQVIAQLEVERQALAMMDHAGIARVLDAGATLEGRPYFVMEIVKGIPVTEYCDRNNLTTDERLALFVQICHAVQHAHQKGIIHRDIKPSNVLVTLHDGKPVPKLLDFGIAKATNQRLSEKTVFTEYSQLIGTPEYMSPEQAEVSGLDVDTRTDIYSLGVLLYELLTGTTPFDGRRLRSAGYGEIQRIIREEEPPKPSTRLGSLATSAEKPPDDDASSILDIARHRQVSPTSLGHLVRGDLDWIVMKALEKDRTRRYETAGALAEDVERHVANQPVSAGPPSASYRFRKFARRHRPAMLSGATVAAAIVLGFSAAVYGFVDASQESAIEKEMARSEAVDAHKQSEAVQDFLSDLLVAVDPSLLGRDVLVRNALEEASKAIESRFMDQPLVRATLRFTIGEAFRGLGIYEAAEPHLLLAAEIRRRELGPRHPELARVLMALAGLETSLARLDEAERAEAAIEILSGALGEDDVDTLNARRALGLVYLKQRRHDEAEPILMDVLERRRRVLGPEHENTLISLNNLGALARRQGRHETAAALFEEALALRRRTLTEDHPKTLISKMNLARAYARLGRDEAAEPLYRAALDPAPKVLGKNHPKTGEFLNNFAKFCLDRDRIDEAESLYASAVAVHRHAFDSDYFGTGVVLLGHGRCLIALGRLDRAEAALLEAHEILERSGKEGRPFIPRAVSALADLYDAAGRPDEAEAWRAKLPPPG